MTKFDWLNVMRYAQTLHILVSINSPLQLNRRFPNKCGNTACDSGGGRSQHTPPPPKLHSVTHPHGNACLMAKKQVELLPVLARKVFIYFEYTVYYAPDLLQPWKLYCPP